MLIIISQIIGLFAVALYLLSYQFKKRRSIVCVTCISNGLYVLQCAPGEITDFHYFTSDFSNKLI